MSETVITLPKPYAAQQIILENAKRNNLLILSRRYGKTTLGQYISCKGAIKKADMRVAWSAPTWKLMIQNWEDIIDLLRPIITRSSREDRRIELINGSFIEMWSTDDPQAGRGRKYHLWVHDEAQRDRNLVKFIRGSARPTLADYRGQLWVLGTANGEGSDLHDFYLDCVQDRSWAVAHGALEDNPYIDGDEIAQMRRDMGPELAAQELDSQWVRVDGIAPFARKVNWDDCYGEGTGPFYRVLAIDGSVSNDTTALIAVWMEQSTGHYYVDYGDITLFYPEQSTGEIDYGLVERTILERWRTGRYSQIAYDPYQLVSLMQRLKAQGVRTSEFTQNSMRLKADGYLRQLIIEGRIHHPDHELLTEHILNATLKFTQDSFRMIKASKSAKIDLAVALSMACWTLHKSSAGSFTVFKPASALATKTRQDTLKSTSSLPTSPFGYLKDLKPWNGR